MELSGQSEAVYQCVLCDSFLKEDGSNNLMCPICRASYPTIEGIRILVFNPNTLLLLHEWQVAARSEDLKHRRKWTEKLNDESASSEVLLRLREDYEGRFANQELVKRCFSPVKQYLDSNSPEVSLLGLLSSFHTGWSFELMTPYFYKDWYGTEEAGFVTNLFLNAINDYCEDGEGRKSVAVLGCGACGLLYEISQLFASAYGLDLSLLTLLLAQKTLKGEEFDLHLSLPNETFPKVQRRLRIAGAKEERSGIRLLAANMTDLPLAPSSISCIITQYMMNIATNHRLLAAEINRVLAPGGVWINFSTPGSLNAYDKATHLDLPWFLKEFGFDLLNESMHRCSLLDFSAISDWRLKEEYSEMFFIARKIHPYSHKGRTRFAEYFSGKDKSILNNYPRLTDRFSISISDRSDFSIQAAKQNKVLEIETWNGYSLLKGPVTDKTALFLERILRLLDGKHTTSKVVELLQRQYGSIANEKELVIFLKSLNDMGVVAL
jgi:SAM-dependent methyltransferase